MKNDIAVIGLGTFGYELAIQLKKRGHGVLAVDIDMKKVNAIKDKVDVAVQADITDEEVLKKLKLNDFHTIIFGMSSALESIILAVTHMRKMNVNYIIGKANTRLKEEILKKIGVDEVVLPEISTAIRLAEKIANPNVLEKFKIDEHNSLIEVVLPDKFAGKSLRDLDFRKKYNINVIMYKRGNDTQMIIDPEIVFEKDDILVIVGKEEQIKKLFVA